MAMEKAGCVLLDIYNKRVGLVYRNKQQDYSFPKGHTEEGEELKQCAVRETEEETGRKCEIISSIELPAMQYVHPKEDLVEVHYYLAVDKGKSEKEFDENLVHDLIWVSVEDVEKMLSYDNLIEYWKKINPLINMLFEKQGMSGC